MGGGPKQGVSMQTSRRDHKGEPETARLGGYATNVGKGYLTLLGVDGVAESLPVRHTPLLCSAQHEAGNAQK
jgi:hypothetical protein